MTAPSAPGVLPCPMCGGPAWCVGQFKSFVMCKEPLCAVQGPERVTKEPAIAAWNTRAPVEVPEETVERVAHAVCRLIEPDDEPCAKCPLRDPGPRGGVRGCIHDAEIVARAALAAMPGGRDAALEEAVEIIRRMDAKMRVVDLPGQQAIEDARAFLAKHDKQEN